MNHLRTFFLALLATSLLAISLLLTSCLRDQCERRVTYTTFEPVYLSFEALRASVQSEAPRDLKMPGKIYFYQSYLLISEVGQGIHVIDNQNPAAPQPVAFINIPGNHDLAVKGGVLYADSYVDLVAIDLSDPQNVRELHRREDVFPHYNQFHGFVAEPERGVIHDWVEVEKTETLDCSQGARDIPWAWGCPNCAGGPRPFGLETSRNDLSPTLATTTGVPQSGAELPAGVGGSLARFTLYQDFLYAITDQDLLVFDIAEVAHPRPSSRIPIGWQIETLYPLHDKLFIGSQTGMFIYDLANPRTPAYLSEFQHVRSCDPVVAEGNFAYVTLREGTNCPGGTNQLDVLDISDLTRPRLVKSYPMYNPHGLGIRNSTLFICDGDAGLRIFDASDVEAIDQNQIVQFDELHALDVIPLTNLLLMIGEDGFYQYDYADLTDIREISRIPIVRE